jgi:hypothetical protein
MLQNHVDCRYTISHGLTILSETALRAVSPRVKSSFPNPHPTVKIEKEKHIQFNQQKKKTHLEFIGMNQTTREKRCFPKWNLREPHFKL